MANDFKLGVVISAKDDTSKAITSVVAGLHKVMQAEKAAAASAAAVAAKRRAIVQAAAAKEKAIMQAAVARQAAWTKGLGTAYSAAGQALRPLTSAVMRAGRVLWNFGTRILRSVINFVRQLINRLRQLAMVTTALVVAATQQAIAAYMGFAKALGEVSTLVDTAWVSMANLGRGVRDLALQTGEAAVDLTKGLYQTISAGVAAGDAVAFLGVAARSAVGGVTDTATAVDGLTTLMNAWGKSASDVTELADSMFTAVKAGKTTFGELAGAYAYIAGTAATAGLSIDEVNAALAAMTTQGMSTQMAARGLNQALISITQPTEEIQKYAKSLGVELSETALRTKGLIGVMADLDRATGGSVEKMGKLLGSSMAARAGLALTGAGGKKFAETLELMNDKAGAAAEAYAKMAGTVGRAWDRLKARFGELKLMVGEALAGAFTNATDAISNFFDATSESGRLQEFVTAITDGLKRAVIGVAAGVGGIVAGIRYLVGEYAESGGSIAKVWEAIAMAHVEAVGFIVRVFKTIEMAVGDTAASSVWDALGRTSFEVFRALGLMVVKFAGLFLSSMLKPLAVMTALMVGLAFLVPGAQGIAAQLVAASVGTVAAMEGLRRTGEALQTATYEGMGTGIEGAVNAAGDAMDKLPEKWKKAWEDPETIKATNKMRQAVADVLGVDIPAMAGDAGKDAGESWGSKFGDAISKGAKDARAAAEAALGGGITVPITPGGQAPAQTGIGPSAAEVLSAREAREAAAAQRWAKLAAMRAADKKAAEMKAAAERMAAETAFAPPAIAPPAAGDMRPPMPVRPIGTDAGDARGMPGGDARDTRIAPIPPPNMNININIEGDVPDPDKLAHAVGMEFDKRMGQWRWAAV